MKCLICAAVLAAATLTTPVLAAEVGVSVNIGEPGFFGRIDIGDAPAPRLISRQAIVAERIRGGAVQEPIYLHVPPGYEKHWSRHCREYGACGQPVYFVRDDWYRDSYVRYYHDRHGDHGDHADRGGSRDEHHDSSDEHRNNHDDRRDSRDEHHNDARDPNQR